MNPSLIAIIIAAFTITTHAITFVSPESTTIWKPGSEIEVTWVGECESIKTFGLFLTPEIDPSTKQYQQNQHQQQYLSSQLSNNSPCKSTKTSNQILKVSLPYSLVNGSYRINLLPINGTNSFKSELFTISSDSLDDDNPPLPIVSTTTSHFISTIPFTSTNRPSATTTTSTTSTTTISIPFDRIPTISKNSTTSPIKTTTTDTNPVSPSNSPPNGQEKNTHTGEILGGIAGLLVIVSIVFAVVYYKRKRQLRQLALQRERYGIMPTAIHYYEKREINHDEIGLPRPLRSLEDNRPRGLTRNVNSTSDLDLSSCSSRISFSTSSSSCTSMISSSSSGDIDVTTDNNNNNNNNNSSSSSSSSSNNSRNSNSNSIAININNDNMTTFPSIASPSCSPVYSVISIVSQTSIAPSHHSVESSTLNTISTIQII